MARVLLLQQKEVSHQIERNLFCLVCFFLESSNK